MEVDEILVATGRKPNTQGLGLEKAGIELTDGQAIKVGDDLQTTNPRVWAAGDVTGPGNSSTPRPMRATLRPATHSRLKDARSTSTHCRE